MQAQLYLDREQDKKLYLDAGRANIDFHFHSHVELLAVERGTVEVAVNDHQTVLHAGEIAVSLSYDAHSYRSPSSARAMSIVIPTQMCGDFISAVQNQKARSPFFSSEVLFQTVCSCYQGIKNSTNPISRKGHLYVLLGTLLEHMELEQQPQTSGSHQFTDILLYLNNHYSEDISLASVAAALGYNASYLSHAFKGCFRISITGYITMLRLRQAVLLMHDLEKSITDCAFESGFQSLRTFYRVFEAEFHCSPKMYRQTQIEK